MSENSGKKNDQNKPDLSLIPKDAIWGIAEALTYGAKKYDRHNFRKGIEFSRLVAACMRHLTAWNEGEELDPESGLSHLNHAMASLTMLKYMTVHKKELDDRFLCTEKIVEDLHKSIKTQVADYSNNIKELQEHQQYVMGMQIQMRGR